MGYETSYASHFRDPLGGLPRRSLTPQAVRAWHAGLNAKTPTARAHGYQLMHAIMATAVSDELVPSNPCNIPKTLHAATKRERVILESIGWAVRTTTSAQTALAQLTGTVDRAVMDAQRAAVAHNAATEGVRCRRHTHYAGACDWCLVMATRGAVYTSAASAVRGHDNCRCLAVAERSGTHYTTPAMVSDAETRYAAAPRQLEDGVVSPTLDRIIRRLGDAA